MQRQAADDDRRRAHQQPQSCRQNEKRVRHGRAGHRTTRQTDRQLRPKDGGRESVYKRDS